MRVSASLMMLLATGPAVASAQARPEGDEWLKRPVDDRTFRTYLSFFAYDHQQPLDLRVASTQDIDGIKADVVSFQSGPGARVTARINYGPATGRGGPGIVLIHGGSPPGKDSPAMKNFAEFLARAGYTTVVFDLQYFGERRTDLLTTFSEAEKHEKLYNQPSAYLGWVTQTVKDAGRSYDLLVERGVDPKRIALIGMSRGGQMSLIVGGADKRFATVLALIAGHFDAGETGHHAAACPANYIGRISPRPLLMINGNLDADYNRKLSVETLQRLAKEPKHFVWHEEGHTLPPESTRAMALQWLRERLK
jgi:dienelactone hydrolase